MSEHRTASVLENGVRVVKQIPLRPEEVEQIALDSQKATIDAAARSDAEAARSARIAAIPDTVTTVAGLRDALNEALKHMRGDP